MSDLCRDRQRERQPTRPHLPDAGRDRRPAGLDQGGAAASGAVPRLPGLRDGLSRRACSTASSSSRFAWAWSRRSTTREARRLVSPLDPVRPVSLSGADAQRAGPGAIGAAAAFGPAGQRAGLVSPAAAAAATTGGNAAAAGQVAAAAAGRAAGDRPRRARVALFTGCVGDAVFRATNWATARVLQQNGCDVIVPQSQGCCGAIHFHAGSSEPARELADANLARVPRRRRRRDHRERGRLRRDAQRLRPPLARRAARCPGAIRGQSEGRQRVSGSAWA